MFKLSNFCPNPMHRAHLIAAMQCDKKLRAAMLFDDEGNIGVGFFCLRSASCMHCEDYLSHCSHVTLGTVTPPLPVEVQGVAESTAPAASHAFPEEAGE